MSALCLCTRLTGARTVLRLPAHSAEAGRTRGVYARARRRTTPKRERGAQGWAWRGQPSRALSAADQGHLAQCETRRIGAGPGRSRCDAPTASRRALPIG